MTRFPVLLSSVPFPIYELGLFKHPWETENVSGPTVRQLKDCRRLPNLHSLTGKHGELIGLSEAAACHRHTEQTDPAALLAAER